MIATEMVFDADEVIVTFINEVTEPAKAIVDARVKVRIPRQAHESLEALTTRAAGVLQNWLKAFPAS